MALKDLFTSKGGLEKLKITAFTDDTYKVSTETYVVMYNPTTFSQQLQSKWIPETGLVDGKQYQFRSLESDSVSFEFLFDASMASPPGDDEPGDVNLDYLGANNGINRESISNNKTSAFALIKEDNHVDRALKRFLHITQNIQSETHKPNYLQINWGAYEFRGVLADCTINYKLFNSAGLPIRATVLANFDQTLSRQEQAAEAAKNSPDMTHKRTVMAGDTLPIMCQRIYGKPGLYMEIARINLLKNFRKLEQGQELIFPPIKN